MRTRNVDLYIFKYVTLDGTEVEYSRKKCKMPRRTKDWKALYNMLDNDKNVKSIIWGVAGPHE